MWKVVVMVCLGEMCHKVPSEPPPALSGQYATQFKCQQQVHDEYVAPSVELGPGEHVELQCVEVEAK